MKIQSNAIDYTGQNIYVGFDVHLKSWKVRKIAQSLRSDILTLIYVLLVEAMEDRILVRASSKFVKESTRNKNRIKSYWEGV